MPDSTSPRVQASIFNGRRFRLGWRSAMPNGPKVSHGGALSPRGDWRTPSDMSVRAWLDAIEREIAED